MGISPPGGNGMELASSDTAAVLFFSLKRERKEVAQKTGRVMPAPTSPILA